MRTRTIDGVEIAISRADAKQYVRSAAEVVGDIMRLGGHDVIFGVIGFQGGKHVQIVGRSRLPYVDVGAVLGQLGGGGHRGAAAAKVKHQSVEEVIDQLDVLVGQLDMHPTRIEQLMSSPVDTIDRAMPLGEAGRRLDDLRISGAPVLRDGKIEGIISRRDIQRAGRADKLELPVSSHMTHEAVTIGPDKALGDALEVMTDRDIGRLPVCRDDRLVGIVSRTDILERLYTTP